MKKKMCRFVMVFLLAANLTSFAAAAEETATPRKDIITVSVVNFHAIWGQNNLARIKGYAEAAAKSGSDLIVFPEMALTGYDLDVENADEERMQLQLAEPVPGPSTEALKEIAEQYQCYIIFGMPEKKDGKIYNSVAVVAPDGKSFSYQKMHPFGAENSWCAKGATPLLLDTEWGPIGIGICYDTYQFPELLRYYCAKGARLYINCTAQYKDPAENSGQASFEDYYMNTLTSHVIANEIYLASCNLVGLDRETFFPGGSLILGPGIRHTTSIGDPVSHLYAGSPLENQEGIFSATLDLSLALRSIYQANPVTGTPDFRPELYQKLYAELATEFPEAK